MITNKIGPLIVDESPLIADFDQMLDAVESGMLIFIQRDGILKARMAPVAPSPESNPDNRKQPKKDRRS